MVYYFYRRESAEYMSKGEQGAKVAVIDQSGELFAPFQEQIKSINKDVHLQLYEGSSIAHQQLKDEYLITDEKIQLMQQIVDRQLSVVPDLYELQNEVSIYIGIPFCPTKCAYCTFPAYAINGRQGSVDSFLGGLHYEMRKVGEWLKENNIRITTVYYGGGTPTSITAEEMDMLYEEMYHSFPDVDKIREVTVEAGRPDTITPEKLEILKKWKIDRISINPQSYTQETLKAIGRHHTVEETIEKFHLAREMGMNNINMDLIIGLPGEGVSEFANSLHETDKLKVNADQSARDMFETFRNIQLQLQQKQMMGQDISEEEVMQAQKSVALSSFLVGTRLKTICGIGQVTAVHLLYSGE